PTFRDNLQVDEFRAAMVTYFDAAKASAALGEKYTILVRGHAFNARTSSRVGSSSSGHVIDVTDYPSIEDLALASDLAVLDYSSLRFDYSLTGKPMIFMVPDVDAYTSTTRGTLVPFEETSPGPHTRTLDETIDCIRNVDAVARAYEN